MAERRDAAGLPPELWHRPTLVVRPRDAAHLYAKPSDQFERLTRRGLLLRMATGYYALVPPEHVGAAPPWRPPLVDTGWAIAVADYGVDAVAICGPAAARHHGLLPRAEATAHIAVPKQRPVLTIGQGTVRFVRRDVARLDLERITTELGDGWVTTLEQTVLDLTARRTRWDVALTDIDDAIRAARPRWDRLLLERLAHDQRRAGALATLDEQA